MMTSKSLWPADTLYVCLEFDQFSAQAISAHNHHYAKKSFVVVRQDAASHRSFVWACSPLAKEKNIQSGIPVHSLKKWQYKPIIVAQDHTCEKEVCREIEDLLCQYTPDYTVSNRGTCLLDLSHTPIRHFYLADEIAEKLKLEIKYKVELEEIAVGIAQSKLVARIMAQLAQPDLTRVCLPGEEQKVLTFLDCRFLPGLSPICREKLKKYGLKKVGQLQHITRFDLLKRFGREGEKLFMMCQGIEGRRYSNKSRGLLAETILKKDINNTTALVRYVRHTTEKLCFQLQLQNKMAKKIILQIRYTDHKTVQKTILFITETNSFSTIAERTTATFKELYTRRVAIRSFRLLVKKPLEDNRQLSLFNSGMLKKQQKNWQGISGVREKIDFNAICSAADLEIFSAAEKGNSQAKVSLKITSAKNNGHLKIPPDLSKKNIFVAAGDFSPKHLQNYQKYFSFSEIQSTLYYESRIQDFSRIEQQSSSAMTYAVVAHKKLSQPGTIDVNDGIKRMRKQIRAISPLLETGCFYTLILQLKDGESRSQKMLEYLVEVAAIARQKRVDVHIEFRHISWQTDFILRVMADNGIGICNTELPSNGFTIPLTSYATSEKGYIRYHGCGSKNSNKQSRDNGKKNYFYSEAEIKERMHGQISLYNKVSQLAITFNNRPFLHAAHNAIHNMFLLNTQLKEISS